MKRRRRRDCEACRIGCDYCDAMECECAHNGAPTWIERVLEFLLHRLAHFRRRAP